MAVDSFGNVLTSTDPTGGQTAWSAPASLALNDNLNSVSCPSTGACVAVDGVGNALVSANPTGGSSAWSPQLNITSGTTDIGHGTTTLHSVSCPTTQLCIAGEDDGYGITLGLAASTTTTTTSPPATTTTSTTPTKPPTVPRKPPRTTYRPPAKAAVISALKGLLAPKGMAASIARIVKNGGYLFSFLAPSPGTLKIRWYQVLKGATITKSHKPKPVLIASVTDRVAKAGEAKVKVKLTPAGRKLLKHARRERLNTKVMFTPKGTGTTSATKAVVLKR